MGLKLRINKKLISHFGIHWWIYKTSLLFITGTIGCSQCPDVVGSKSIGKSLGVCKSESKKSESSSTKSPENINVEFNKNTNHFEITGINLDSIDSVKLKNNNTDTPLTIIEKNSTKLLADILGSNALLIGAYRLILSTAQAESAVSIYLDVADGSITDAKIVSISATKISGGTLSLAMVPDLSTTYSSVNHNHVGIYAPLSHTHVAADVGAINTSVGSADAGKVVMLSSDGKINPNMLKSDDSRVYVSLIGGSQSIASSTWTTVIYSTDYENTLSEYDLATGIFTPAKPGLYQVSAGLLFSSVAWTAGQACAVAIYVNSTEMVAYGNQIMPTATGACSANASTAVYFSGTGTIRIKAYQDRGSSTNLEASSRSYNSLSIVRIK